MQWHWWLLPLFWWVKPTLGGWSGGMETTTNAPVEVHETATPYYFGTTDLSCMHRNIRGKRSAPSRGTLEWVHRFIFYKGYYFEFFDNSKAYISTQRQFANVCPGGPESSPAGYSELDIDCIKGCARNYRCHFGSYSLLGNNCHHFTNEISRVLCTSGQSCPAWCLDDCNHAVERN
ncbi:uncharacterized protein LOC128181767 isoform X2 [Crassostrea angulata]|uniref:uncharacterized protein LOC128181767 isoform X2 n=1 Tax=Magallana angulata TaxID=2784310 RepID=UPI0022B180BD|nr:uncharacterized protein LOC128181767 isoform X2 [Crassostrea angulata]